MDNREAQDHLTRLVDGQSIQVLTSSGRTFDGIYNGEASSLEAGLHFDTLEGAPLRAEWDKVQTLSFRSARATVGSMMVPPEHPLSGQSQNRLRAYTVRHPAPGTEG